jgi:transcriptional regulator with XRE-family HTH domain
MIQELNTKTSTLSRRILQALLDRGLTQSEIAVKLGANRSHVSRVKSGEHEFTDAQLELIERMTGVPLGLLLLGTEPTPDSSAEVRRLYKEARQILAKSAAIRGKM